MFKILDLKEGTYLQSYLNSGKCVGDRDFLTYETAIKEWTHIFRISKYINLKCLPDKARNFYEFEIVEVPDV
jgi:hypothetical protein